MEENNIDYILDRPKYSLIGNEAMKNTIDIQTKDIYG